MGKGEKKSHKGGEPELHWLLAFFVYFSYATIIGVSQSIHCHPLFTPLSSPFYYFYCCVPIAD